MNYPLSILKSVYYLKKAAEGTIIMAKSNEVNETLTENTRSDMQPYLIITNTIELSYLKTHYIISGLMKCWVNGD